MLSSMSCGMSSSRERIELASLASRASRLRSWKSMMLGDEMPDAEVTSETVDNDSESESWVPLEEAAIDEVSLSIEFSSFAMSSLIPHGRGEETDSVVAFGELASLVEFLKFWVFFSLRVRGVRRLKRSRRVVRWSMMVSIVKRLNSNSDRISFEL